VAGSADEVAAIVEELMQVGGCLAQEGTVLHHHEVGDNSSDGY